MNWFVFSESIFLIRKLSVHGFVDKDDAKLYLELLVRSKKWPFDEFVNPLCCLSRRSWIHLQTMPQDHVIIV